MKKRLVKQAKIEDYDPGATKSQVFADLKKVITVPKPSQKRVEPPDSASK